MLAMPIESLLITGAKWLKFSTVKINSLIPLSLRLNMLQCAKHLQPLKSCRMKNNCRALSNKKSVLVDQALTKESLPASKPVLLTNKLNQALHLTNLEKLEPLLNVRCILPIMDLFLHAQVRKLRRFLK